MQGLPGKNPLDTPAGDAYSPRTMSPCHPPNPELRKLKAAAQHLEPVARVGKAGLTPTVLAGIEQVLAARELIKIRFEHERDERDVLATQIAEATQSALIMQVGKVAVYYRPKPPATETPVPA
jgi:RNA-binding protein